MSADRRQTDTGLERGPRARRPVRFYFVREDGRTYIQLGWAASDAFSRSSRSQGSNRGHMTLQSSVNIARDPVSLHRTVGACACGSLALVLYSLLSVAGPLTLPHRSAAGPSPSLSHREISLPPRRPAARHYTTTPLQIPFRHLRQLDCHHTMDKVSGNPANHRRLPILYSKNYKKIIKKSNNPFFNFTSITFMCKTEIFKFHRDTRCYFKYI